MSNNLFPFCSSYLEKGSFIFSCENWPTQELADFFEKLPEVLVESGYFEASELTNAESAEIVIPAVHKLAQEATDSGSIGQKDYLSIVENFVVIAIFYVENLSGGLIMCDFSGDDSESGSESDWD